MNSMYKNFCYEGKREHFDLIFKITQLNSSSSSYVQAIRELISERFIHQNMSNSMMSKDIILKLFGRIQRSNV